MNHGLKHIIELVSAAVKCDVIHLRQLSTSTKVMEVTRIIRHQPEGIINTHSSLHVNVCWSGHCPLRQMDSWTDVVSCRKAGLKAFY